MPIHVNCPDCNKSYKVDEKYDGKKIRCKDCGAIIEVYATPLSPDDEEEYYAQEERSERRRRRIRSDDDFYPSSSAPKSNISQVLGVLAIVLGAIGLVLSFIPCIGFIGLPAAGLGLILGIIGIFVPEAAKTNGRTLSITGTCLSLLAFLVVGIITFVINRAANDMAKKAEELHEENKARMKEHQDKFIEEAAKAQTEHEARSGVNILEMALKSYMAQNGSVPKSIDDLQQYTIDKNPKRLIDPWGNPYKIGELTERDGKKIYYIYTINPLTKEEIRNRL
jgi:transcription initiation factor TFIIIB Brf1 subunit/transcription initiation factor TFIIB